MEKIHQNTSMVCREIRELLTELENNNNKIIEENKPQNISEQERPPAGISTRILHNSEITWRRHLRGWRHFPRY